MDLYKIFSQKRIIMLTIILAIVFILNILPLALDSVHKANLNQTHDTPWRRLDIDDCQPLLARLPIFLGEDGIDDALSRPRNESRPLIRIALLRIRQHHHLQILGAHHALHGGRHDADPGRQDLVHDDDARVRRHAGHDGAQDPRRPLVAVVVQDHAQEIDGGALDGLRGEHVVRHELDARAERLGHHARRRVRGLRNDRRHILHHDAHPLVRRLGDRHRAVARVAGDVDHDAVRGQPRPVEPARDVRVGHHRVARHVGHEARETVAHLGPGFVELVHRRLGVVVEVERALVRLRPSVPEALEGLELPRSRRERVERDELVERPHAPVRQESRRRRVRHLARRRFCEHVQLHQLPQHLLELRGVEGQFARQVRVTDCVVVGHRGRNFVRLDIAESVEVVDLYFAIYLVVFINHRPLTWFSSETCSFAGRLPPILALSS